MSRGVLAGVLVAVTLVACAGGRSKSAMAPSAAQDAAPAAVLPDAHAEIDRLDREITAERQRMGLGALPPAPIAPVCETCAQAMGTTPLSTDPACQHGTSDTCNDVCRLSDSICDNAARICVLADQMAGDRWAADKCSTGKASCSEAHDTCCACK